MTIRREGNGFEVLSAALKDLDGVEGKAGWFESATYKKGMPVAAVAYINEHGAITNGGAIAAAYQSGGKGAKPGYIPPRPFMRMTAEREQEAWLGYLEAGAGDVLDGSKTALQVVELVALKAAGDIGKTIATFTTPPNAPSTIKRKGINAPLRDTKQMLQSVTGVAERSK